MRVDTHRPATLLTEGTIGVYPRLAECQRLLRESLRVGTVSKHTLHAQRLSAHGLKARLLSTEGVWTFLLRSGIAPNGRNEYLRSLPGTDERDGGFHSSQLRPHHLGDLHFWCSVGWNGWVTTFQRLAPDRTGDRRYSSPQPRHFNVQSAATPQPF